MLASAIKQFKYYKQLGEKSIAQVSDESLFHSHHEDDNSIAVVVQHISGNMKSRWTNIFVEDGEKSWRNREQEFIPHLNSRSEIMKVWAESWSVLFQTLENLKENDIQKIIYIRNEGLTVEDAILRQLCHYSYHIGQIVYKARQTAGNNWVTLSIAKGKSEEYNIGKFDQPRTQKHFLDDLLDKK